ncbi:MAG: tetratricopeptide repeat protein [Nitrospinae bacterium]|nr:tetratricopeptide repeat protein [Nitrospinota bacterium]
MRRSHRCLLEVAVAATLLGVLGSGSVLSPEWAVGEVASSRKEMAVWRRCVKTSGANRALALQGRNPDWETNIILCKEALDLETDSQKISLSLVALAGAYLGKGGLDAAISIYREAIRLKPDVDLHFFLADVHKKKGQDAEAVAVYKRIISLRPDNATAHLYLGKTYEDMGQWDEATAFYEEAIRLKPDLAEAHHNLGMAYEKKGHSDKAIASYKAAIHHKPDLAEANYHLGVVYALKGRRALADHYLYEAANAYLKAGRREGAVKAYGHLKSLKSSRAHEVFKKLYP